VPSHPLGDDALGAEPAGLGEHDRAIRGDVLVEQNASLDTMQQMRQCRLAVEERAIAQILAIVMLDQIEGIQARGMRGLSSGRKSSISMICAAASRFMRAMMTPPSHPRTPFGRNMRIRSSRTQTTGLISILKPTLSVCLLSRYDQLRRAQIVVLRSQPQ
jgi:hypothetical protein